MNTEKICIKTLKKRRDKNKMEIMNKMGIMK